MANGELQSWDGMEDIISVEDVSVVAPGTIGGNFVRKEVIGAVGDDHQLVRYHFKFRTLYGSPMPDKFKVNLLEVGGVATPIVEAPEKPTIEG